MNLKMKYEIHLLRSFFFITLLVAQINISTSENVKKSIDDARDDNGDTNDESKDESLDIPSENEPVNITCTRRANSQMHEIRDVEDTKQFPFVGAVMSHQNEYLCAASVISNGLFLTTAKCTLQPVSFILVNATKDRRDEGATPLNVIKTEKFPSFSGSDSLKDVGVIYTVKFNSSVATKIRVSNYTNARSLVDVEGIGFGLNADVGQPKVMQYIGMELRSIFETGDVLKGYFDCVETKVNTCFKDSGGPVIYDNELVGIVSKGQEDCTKEMSATYAINKKIADILPTFIFKSWLDEKIKTNEERTVAGSAGSAGEQTTPSELHVYPIQPARRADIALDEGTTPFVTVVPEMKLVDQQESVPLGVADIRPLPLLVVMCSAFIILLI